MARQHYTEEWNRAIYDAYPGALLVVIVRALLWAVGVQINIHTAVTLQQSPHTLATRHGTVFLPL